MNQIKTRVAKILTQFPDTRDDDRLLCCYYWRDQLAKMGKNTHTLYMQEFFVEYTFGELADAQTITRFRRLLQNESPMFRGLKYAEKQEKQEKVKDDLGY